MLGYDQTVMFPRQSCGAGGRLAAKYLDCTSLARILTQITSPSWLGTHGGMVDGIYRQDSAAERASLSSLLSLPWLMMKDTG
jgi:hypothetical protein